MNWFNIQQTYGKQGYSYWNYIFQINKLISLVDIYLSGGYINEYL